MVDTRCLCPNLDIKSCEEHSNLVKNKRLKYLDTEKLSRDRVSTQRRHDQREVRRQHLLKNRVAKKCRKPTAFSPLISAYINLNPSNVHQPNHERRRTLMQLECTLPVAAFRPESFLAFACAESVPCGETKPPDSHPPPNSEPKNSGQKNRSRQCFDGAPSNLPRYILYLLPADPVCLQLQRPGHNPTPSPLPGHVLPIKLRVPQFFTCTRAPLDALAAGKRGWGTACLAPRVERPPLYKLLRQTSPGVGGVVAAESRR